MGENEGQRTVRVCVAVGRVRLHSEDAKRSEGKKPINGLKGKYPSPETEG